jgi:RNA polymerase sigma-70 factor (ECF subfamily)
VPKNLDLTGEAVLIEKARRFDQEAITELYNRYAEGIYHYALVRVADMRVAEDITSDVFLRALEGLKSFEYRGVPFSAWLYRIARDRVVDYYRACSRRKSTVALDESIQATTGSPERAVLNGFDLRELQDALEGLSEEQRLVVVLRFLDGKSLSEVARQLGKTEGAIKSLQHRALAALGRALGGREG